MHISTYTCKICRAPGLGGVRSGLLVIVILAVRIGAGAGGERRIIRRRRRRRRRRSMRRRRRWRRRRWRQWRSKRFIFVSNDIKGSRVSGAKADLEMFLSLSLSPSLLLSLSLSPSLPLSLFPSLPLSLSPSLSLSSFFRRAFSGCAWSRVTRAECYEYAWQRDLRGLLATRGMSRMGRCLYENVFSLYENVFSLYENVVSLPPGGSHECVLFV